MERRRLVLYNYLGTQYIHKGMTVKLDEILNIITNDKEQAKTLELDIKHCKFHPDNQNHIREYQKVLHVVDSVTPAVDLILRHNEDVYVYKDLEDSKQLMVEYLPMDMDPLNLNKYLQSMDDTKIYRVRSGLDHKSNGIPIECSLLLALTVLLQRKDVSLDLDHTTKRFFGYFKKFWTIVPGVNYNSYFISWDSTFIRVDAVDEREDGSHNFYIPGYGIMKEEYLRKEFEIIPVELPTKVEEHDNMTELELLKMKEYQKMKTAIGDAWTVQYEILQARQRKTLKSFLISR